MNPIYSQFTDQVAAAAAGVSGAQAELASFAWLAGRWLWHENPVEFAVAPYGVSARVGAADEPFLIYNSAAGMWVMVLLDPAAFGMLIGSPMQDGRTRFTGDVTVGESSVQIRQFWRILPDRTVAVRSERRRNGRWTPWSTDVLRPFRPSSEAGPPERSEDRKTTSP